MPRELVVLGTASQAPTRSRNQNGYLLRWDELGLLFDPGEGTQRQLLLAGERSSTITHVVVTHEHGDHCLGLPGVLQRMALDQRSDPVVLVHPESATPYLDGLLGVGLFDGGVPLERHRLAVAEGALDLGGGRALHHVPLDHRVPTLGYRLQEPDGRRFRPAALQEHGLEGPIVGRLARDGAVHVNGTRVGLEEVSDPVRGQSMAFVMDTRVCAGAADLLHGVDLGVVESTFLAGDEGLAERFGHLTAGQAGRLAAGAGVRRLVLTHYSQRYEAEQAFAEEAGRHHGDVVAARDLQRIAVPARLGVPAS